MSVSRPGAMRAPAWPRGTVRLPQSGRRGRRRVRRAIRRPLTRGWDAWMGVVTAEAGTRLNTSGGVVHFTGIAWSGQVGEPVSSAPAQARGRVRLGCVPGGPSRALGSARVASPPSSSCTARTLTSRSGCGCGAAASASSRRPGWTTTTRSPRAATSGACWSATGGRRPADLSRSAAGAARAGAAGDGAGAGGCRACLGVGMAEAAGQRDTLRAFPRLLRSGALSRRGGRSARVSSRGC